MKILLVDDSKSARYALRLQLQRLGVEVDTAESAEAAIAMLEGDLPDAILMDHSMPGLNGLEALDIIRSDPHTAQVPVVMCTSHEDPDYAADAQRRGAAGVLPKVTATEKLPEILSALQSGLDQAQSAAALTEPAPPTAIAPTAPAGYPAPDLLRQIEDRIDARLTSLIEPLLQDLERNLSERLLATTRELVESRSTEARELIEARLTEARLAEERRAPQVQPIAAELESAAARLVAETLPELVRIEIDTERGQVMALVDQYLRELSAQATPMDDRGEGRLAALDDLILAKTREVAKREATEAGAGIVTRTQRVADDMMRQLRTSLALVYLAILGAALIGILAAAASFFLSH